MLKFIQNIGDYFSTNYFDEDFTTKVLSKTGYASDDVKDFNKRISPLKDRYYRFKQTFIEGRLRTKDKIYECHQYHTLVLNALGYDGAHPMYSQQLYHLSDQDVIPVRHILYRGDQPHLMVMEMQALIREEDTEPDGLFEQQYNVEDDSSRNAAQRYHRNQWDRVFSVPDGVRISPVIINKAISEIFLIDPHQRPKYILLLAGNVIFLLEQEKWFRGSYLQIDLEELFSEATAHRNANYYALIYFLLGKETLAPESNLVLLDQLDEDSHKSAYEVTKDLKEGIIHAVEALANEALYYQKEILNEEFDESDDTFEQQIKDDCLKIIYRLLFIFYAESRDDLDILPTGDALYNKGYSLEMLRDLEQVPLYMESSLNGYFFHESLSKLFYLLSSGYRERENGQNKSFKVRHLDSPLFDDSKLDHLHKVKFRNSIWQDIICRLSLSRQQRGKTRGRISYANLGINQLGSVYESLLAYRGFYAEQDYIEVHKAGQPNEGTYLVPRKRRDDFQEDEILKEDNGHDTIIRKGSFVYRLSGRDRQKSASYYTPEVLTQCVVKYTLKPILERLDKGEMKATELLEQKILEPAMGAAAFHNEMINQLAEAYLNYRQQELRDSNRKEWKVAPDKYREELQKVKAYIATNNTYGVDLNPTAIELGKLSLWLNVIHRDMETPFFSNRLAVGNAVVGAWLKVYKHKDIREALGTNGRPLPKQPKIEWWETAPRLLEFKPTDKYEKIQHGRKPDEVYHFLLPDKNMVPSAGIKMLKEQNPAEAKAATAWRKEWCKPISATELELLEKICQRIDAVLTEYYRFQRTINLKTRNKQQLFGAYYTNTQGTLDAVTYDAKEKLADQRHKHDAPYFKLKMIMDYWCSLWFWDMREAGVLPSRQQYWQDIQQILQMDVTEKTSEYRIMRRGQQKLFESSVQTELPYPGESPDVMNDDDMLEAIVHYTDRQSLFDDNQRLRHILLLSESNHFFHPQLEFLEVFWERGGFDLIAGNPPWLKLQFEETGIISEIFPEVAIKKVSAPNVRALQETFFKDSHLKSMYFEEMMGIESTAVFLNARQNYPLLLGQQTNLYKCILENGFSMLNKQGSLGLLHPEGVYDDPNGQPLRKEMYLRLKYHFQFQNAFNLFAEVAHREKYGINIYSGSSSLVSFSSINNLFHPGTIDGCFIHDGNGVCGGIKTKGDGEDGFVWNTKPHKDRIVNIGEKELRIISTTFEDSSDWDSAKLVSVHTSSVFEIISKIGNSNTPVSTVEYIHSECWHETNAQNDKIITRKTDYPSVAGYEVIYSGPNISIGNPFYKTPKEICTEKAHYDVVLTQYLSDDFIPRVNYFPSINIEEYKSQIIGFNNTSWFDFPKLIWRKMLSQAGERTLLSTILFPKSAHIDGCNSLIFSSDRNLIQFAGLSFSLPIDFYIKTTGKATLRNNVIQFLPFGIDSKFKHILYVRTLVLNCLNKHYAPLWDNNYIPDFANDQWSIPDLRLKPYSTLGPKWTWETPLRNFFERRYALVEIDIIAAMALGLSLKELILIYNVQFPVLQQNEDDTWYDTTGNIVFTCSKGLVGVGVDRAVWNDIRDLPAGTTYEHTITKSELYHGKKVIYYAPFDKCDRVEDYRVAWAHFEKIFKD